MTTSLSRHTTSPHDRASVDPTPVPAAARLEPAVHLAPSAGHPAPVPRAHPAGPKHARPDGATHPAGPPHVRPGGAAHHPAGPRHARLDPAVRPAVSEHWTPPLLHRPSNLSRLIAFLHH